MGAYRNSRGWMTLALGALFALLLGAHGFRERLAPDRWWRQWLDAVYLALQLFTLNSENLTGPLPWSLQLARFLAPLVAASAAVATVFELFRDRLAYLRLRRWTGHYVVVGLGNKGLQLVEDLRRDGYRVVVIEKDEDNSALKRCRELSVVVVAGDGTEGWVLREARVEVASRLFAATNDDGVNVEVGVRARELRAAARAWGGLVGPLDCFIHIRDPRLRMRLESRRAGKAAEGCRFRYFNVYQESARLLMDLHPPLAPPGTPPEAPREILIIGFGNMGEHLAVQTARLAHFADGRRLVVNVLDRRLGPREAAFRSRYPRLADICTLGFLEVDTATPASFEEVVKPFAARRRQLFAVYVCLDSDAAALECALALEELLRGQDVPVVVRTEHDRGLASLLTGAAASARPRLVPFGVISSVCRSRSLLGEGSDKLARMFHQAGLPGRGTATTAGSRKTVTSEAPRVRAAVAARLCAKVDASLEEPAASASSGASSSSAASGSVFGSASGTAAAAAASTNGWEELDETSKDSDRQRAAHAFIKLRAIGMEAVEAGPRPGPAVQFTPDEVDTMARMEHDRWLAGRLMDGWQRGAVEDRGERTSPFVVPWDTLPEERREITREAVRQLPARLKDVGLEVRRCAR